MFEQAQRIRSLGPDIVHGFSTRIGGVSTGPHATLNFGRRWGDEPDRVDENYRRLGEAAGFDPGTLQLVRQVHEDAVIRARDVQPGSRADAIWCHRDDGPTVVAVLTADCVPVLIADRDGMAVAAVHSGWRGTVAGVVPAAVAVLQDAGAPAARLVAAIGPCIEQAAFEVGPEVAAQFSDAFVDRSGDRPHVDLVAAVRDQLHAAGVAAVERVGGCTHANASRYFSYRRDGAGIGQMLSFIGLGG